LGRRLLRGLRAAVVVRVFLHKLHMLTGSGGLKITGQILSAGNIGYVRLNLPNTLHSQQKRKNVGSIHLVVTFGVHYQPPVRSKSSSFSSVRKAEGMNLAAITKNKEFNDGQSTFDCLQKNDRCERMDAFTPSDKQQHCICQLSG
jgi:hypothetical protein